jgi:zinc transporter ZupT
LVETIQGLLAFSFAFAAGAMLSLVASDLAPRALRENTWRGVLGALIGAALMISLGAALGV